mmetsp:Transcript_11168/g.16832  ORF Transcript_11168/g.16832 Transcript_11168/m.16832 type:complete len:565 (-) Transcript_11168:98-1792(-)
MQFPCFNCETEMSVGDDNPTELKSNNSNNYSYSAAEMIVDNSFVQTPQQNRGRELQQRMTTTVGMLRSRRNLNRIAYHINSRTSIKLFKPRNSGARYLTRSEIIGISLSAFLSLLIASVTVYVVQTFSSTVFNNITDFLESVQSVSQMALQSSPQIHQHTPSQFLPLVSDFTWTQFTSNYLNKNPVLFHIFRPNETGIYSNIINALSGEYASHRVNIKNVNSLDFISNTCEKEVPKNSNPFQKWILKNDKKGKKKSKEEPIIEIALKDLQESINIESRLPPAIKGQDNYYISDCQAFNHMTKLKEILLRHPPVLPLHHSDLNQLVPLFNSFDPSNIWLTIALTHWNLSSSSFHTHRHSVNLLLSGRKHWVIFSPEHLPLSGFNSFENLEQWLHNPITSQSTTATSQPFEVLQEPGQAVYVPEGWYHAARSLSSSPAVSIRWQAAGEEVGNYYRYLVEGERRMRAQDYAGAVMSFKLGLSITRDVTLLQRLAAVLVLQQSHREAAALYEELLLLNPSDPRNYAHLISLILSSSDGISSMKASDILRKAAEFNLKDTVLRLSQSNF